MFTTPTEKELKWPLTADEWKKVYDAPEACVASLAKYLDTSVSSPRIIRHKMEQVLLQSKEPHYDPVSAWFAYMALLERGEPFQWPWLFEMCPPFKGIWVPWKLVGQNSKQLVIRLAPLLYKFKLDQITEARALAERELGKPVTRWAVLAVLCSTNGLCYSRSRLMYPRRYPMQPLEKALWEKACHDPWTYNQLATEFNRSCPIWILYYRSSFKYYAIGTLVGHFDWSSALGPACPSGPAPSQSDGR